MILIKLYKMFKIVLDKEPKKYSSEFRIKNAVMYLKYLARLILISSVLLTLTASLTQSDNGVFKDKTYVFIPSLLYSMWIAPITGFPKMELNKNDYESTNTASPKKEGCPNLRWRKCKEKRLKIIARD